ncbi:MAG: motility associated factor glycosyltransferase family protein [Lachnospiraceae bacterium]|jgi:hypothetical protein|nr:motility associated factor glycosyltransferase family protein [Lachnospiraceae bacterium]
MGIYEKNLKTLAKYYPEMDVMIKEAKDNLQPDLEILEEVSCDGEVILKIKRGDRICYLNGRRNAKEPAQVWVKTLGELQRNAPVFIVGVGNPSYLRELVEQTEKRIAIIVYEPSLQIFLKFLEMVDIESWMEKHLLVFWVEGIRDMDAEHVKGIFQTLFSYETLNFSRSLILPNYDVLFTEKIVDYMRIRRDIVLNEVLQFNTKEIFSHIMVRNLFSNVKYLCDGYKTTQLVEVIPRDIPGIVVAAGPSLNKNIQELKHAKGKAFIIAVDTAMKPLLDAGIEPDMFAVIDAMKPLELVKIEKARSIPLLTMLNAAPEVLDYHTGMKFFFNQGYEFAEKIFRKSKWKEGEVSCGGSVATSVFSLLYKIGINTIILVGQDLAYTDNKSHADGTFHEVMEQVDTSKFRMVEGNYEKEVPTRSDFKVFIDWYNMYIEGCKNYREGFRVINATEGGAKINNTEVMALKDAIEKECTKEVDIQACLRQLPPMLDEEGRTWAVEHLQSMPKEFVGVSKEANKIKKQYLKLDKICDKKKIDNKEYLHILKELEKHIQLLEQNEAYQLIEITMNSAKSILRNEQFLSEESVQEEGKEIARKGILYMENVVKMADVFKEYAQEVFSEEALAVQD